MRAADWIIDLGPGAADEGGQIVAQGPPETLAAHPDSITGRYLQMAASP
jgi:excinuclease ABC subunit A